MNSVNRNKIYKQELKAVGKYAVWLVDGEYIRKELDENFVGYDAQAHLKFIPKFELWIDKSSNPDEHHFFIDHLLTEAKAIEDGYSYEEASLKADRFEKKERAKVIDHPALRAPLLSKEGKHTFPSADILEKIHTSLYKESAGLKIWFVDGKAVRDYCDVEYAEGGHDLVYSYIPKNEIWIENSLSTRETQFIVLHELHERNLMSKGKDYHHAHLGATIVEDYYRDHPAELEQRIKEEIKKTA